MDNETTIWIKEEAADDVPEPGTTRCSVAAMEEQETSISIKEEEIVEECNEPDSERCSVAAMEEQETSISIKEEEIVEECNEPDSERCSVADMEEQETSISIKEEEIVEECNEPDSGFLEDAMRIEDPGLHIKQDPELDLDVDGPEHNVVVSRSYASNRTRLVQSNERCDFPVEEIVSQGVSHNELEIGSEESTHFIMFREGEEEEKEEESLSAPRLKCSLRENKCQIFFCSFCLQSFSSKYRLMMHVFVHIDGVEPPKSVCKSCGEVFPSYVSLKKHLEISEPEQDSSADKEESFHCIGKSFTNLLTLKGHALIDTDSRTNKCDIGGKAFTQSSYLKSHALIHTRARQHKCDICGKSFTRLSDFKKHALLHTGIKPHKCDICGKSFTRLSHLREHALLHTGTKPHKCEICGKSFTQSSHLSQHALIHTGTKTHKCDYCGKSFTLLCNLKRHVLIHTGTISHKCDFCGKSFTRLSDLKRHGLIHTGTAPQV